MSELIKRVRLTVAGAKPVGPYVVKGKTVELKRPILLSNGTWVLANFVEISYLKANNVKVEYV